MKSSINFYTDDLKPRIEIITLSFVLTMAIVSVALMLGISWWAASHHETVKSQGQQLSNQRTSLESQIKSLSEALTSRRPEQALLMEVASAEKTLQDNKLLLARLNDRSRLASHDYPSLMLDLAKAHHQDVWLSRILVNGEQVYLQGSASAAESVPEWIAQLSDVAFFHGVEFESAQISENDQQQVDFVLGALPKAGGQ